MSIQRSRSKGSSGSHSKHIPTPPPPPIMRSVKTLKTPTFKHTQSSFHSGATIAYDGIGRVVWLKDVENKKIYFNQNKPLTLSEAEIKAIQRKNADLGIKHGGKRRNKRTRKHKRKHY